MNLTILLITYLSGPFAGDESAIPFPSAAACGQVMLDLIPRLPYPADLQCIETDVPSTSPRPKPRPGV